jgi:hypothetical protein
MLFHSISPENRHLKHVANIQILQQSNIPLTTFDKKTRNFFDTTFLILLISFRYLYEIFLAWKSTINNTSNG